MKRRNFLKTLGAGTAGIAAFSCKDQDAARRIAERQRLPFRMPTSPGPKHPAATAEPGAGSRSV